MDPGQIISGLSWTLVLAVLLGAYTVSVALFLILENRSPQSTFAWLFLLLVFPVGGVLIYLLVGRRTHVFSRERNIGKLLEGRRMAERVADVMARQPARLAELELTQGENARVAPMSTSSLRDRLRAAPRRNAPIDGTSGSSFAPWRRRPASRTSAFMTCGTQEPPF